MKQIAPVAGIIKTKAKLGLVKFFPSKIQTGKQCHILDTITEDAEKTLRALMIKTEVVVLNGHR